MIAEPDSELVSCAASAIKDAFAAYHADFEIITRRAKKRFERREWHELHQDAEERLDDVVGLHAEPRAGQHEELLVPPPVAGADHVPGRHPSDAPGIDPVR